MNSAHCSGELRRAWEEAFLVVIGRRPNSAGESRQLVNRGARNRLEHYCSTAGLFRLGCKHDLYCFLWVEAFCCGEIQQLDSLYRVARLRHAPAAVPVNSIISELSRLWCIHRGKLGRFYVKAYVDAQNAFGGVVRSAYTVIMP